ncbi:hypothetical protein [Kineococcus sp. SYSU DK001]|uniref:hypothetical protein n=1 Tax=Kineococcus sp. SYSU DK001 TaxID=3383122 RepID=UPI003D7E055B
MTLFVAGAVVVAALLVGVAAGPYVRWGQPFSPVKFGQFLAEAAGQLAALAVLLTFIVVVFRLLHAFNTAGARTDTDYGSRGASRTGGGWRWALGLPAARPRRTGASQPAAGGPAASSAGPGLLALPASGPGRVGPWSSWPSLLPSGGLQAPSLRSLRVEPVVTGEGLPVTVSWDFTDADEVIVAGHSVRQSKASLSVVPGGSGPLEVVALNGAGARQEWTAAVTVLPIPRLDSLDLPAAPTVRLSVDVSAVLDARAPTGALRHLFARQDGHQLAGQLPEHVPSPRLSPLLVPSGLRHWWRTSTRHLHAAVERTQRSRGTATRSSTTGLPTGPDASPAPEEGSPRRD